MRQPSSTPGRWTARFLLFARRLAVLVLLVVVTITAWILLHCRDSIDSEDEDLLAASVDRRGGGAAHRTWAALGGALADFDHARAQAALAAARAGDFSDAAWVREQADRFAALRDRLLHPLPVTDPASGVEVDLSDGTVDEGLIGLHTLARITSARALELSRRGEVDAAVDDASYGLRVGLAISGHRDLDLIGLMIAGATQSISLATLEQIARENPITPEMARHITDEIGRSRVSRESWQQMWANEYLWVRGVYLGGLSADFDSGALMEAAGEDWGSRWMSLVPDAYLVQPNRTLAHVARRYRDRRNWTGSDCLAIYSRRINAVEPMDYLSVLVHPNPVGELMVLISDPNMERFELKRCAFEKNFALAQVVIASKAHLDREGQLPESLDALVPRYLGAVPVNPYDGAALGYSAREAKVSVDASALAVLLGSELLGSDLASALEDPSMARALVGHAPFEP